jgi:hypothetical protein
MTQRHVVDVGGADGSNARTLLGDLDPEAGMRGGVCGQPGVQVGDGREGERVSGGGHVTTVETE